MVQPQHLAEADRLRERHESDIERVRGRRELNDTAKVGLMARIHNDAKEQMSKLEQTAQQSTAAKRATLERSTFGIADLPGDAATNAVSFRDAQDRTSRVESPADAAALLSRAERAGDEPLARAVAAHAHDLASTGVGRLDSGWGDVLNAYVATRPGKADNVRQLADLRTDPRDVRAMFSFVLAAPSEISNVPSGLLRQYADAADSIR